MMRRWVATGAVLVLAALGYGVVPPAEGGGDGSNASDSGMTLGHTPRALGTTSATVVIGPRGHLFGFATPNVSISPGGDLRVVNQENLTHTFTSVAVDANGDPLFDVVIPPNSTRRVPAVSDLAPGTYRFNCRIHPNMRGTLTVLGAPPPQPPPSLKFEQPLMIPRVLTGDHITLRAHQTWERVLPHGPRTPMWTYGGSYPGPTIIRNAGDDTRLTIVNRLSARAGQLTLHFHGDHHASQHDGQPNTQLIPRFGSKTYDYPLTEEGKPELAAFEFYHDHRMDLTSRNIWRGLEGMFIVHDRREQQLRLPSGRYDVPLVVADRSFDDQNHLLGTFTDHMMLSGPHKPPNDATVGSKILVNGRFAPYAEVAARRYRLRILNGSNFSVYDFKLSDGRPFLQIGTGNGLLPHPVKRDEILLGPAQRVDVVVDFHRELGKNIVLKSVARTDNAPRGIGSREANLMQFRVTNRAPDPTRVPWDLGRIPPIRVPAKVAKTFVFGLGGDPDGTTFWTVDGRPFDPDRTDHFVTMGSTEKWVLRNDAPIAHFIHLHEERWHTILRDGHRPPPWERGLEDTWRLDPGESVVVAGKFTDFAGRFMIHCHMLDHEDHGLMAQFAVVRRAPAGARLVAQAAAYHPRSGAGTTMPMSDGSDMGTGPGSSVVVHSGDWSRVLSRTGSALAVELIVVVTLVLMRRRIVTAP
jgi:spore coat protein A